MTKNELIREIFKAFDGKQVSEDTNFREGLQEGFDLALEKLREHRDLKEMLRSISNDVNYEEGNLLALETVQTILLRAISKENKDESL